MFQRLIQPFADVLHGFSPAALIRLLTVLVDIGLVAMAIYKLLVLVRSTRAAQVLRGLWVLILLYFATQWLHLYTVNWILGQLWIPGVIALVIIFQPELRMALEQIGRGRFLRSAFRGMRGEELTHAINEITDAVNELSDRRFGALIVMERDNPLAETVETGKPLNATVSADLLVTIFYPGSALHDGAAVTRHAQIAAAGCILPLSRSSDLDSRYGTRHRAALGLAEHTDAVVVVVSEETGAISVAMDGHLEAGFSPQVLKERLLSIFQEHPPAWQRQPLLNWLGGGGGRAK